MEEIGPDELDRLRRRRMMKVTRPATIPKKTTPPITPPAIAPAFDLLFLFSAVEVEETMVVELPVAWGPADDSGPTALSAAAGLKVSFVTTFR